jgi:para-nitrobenzyl esterase
MAKLATELKAEGKPPMVFGWGPGMDGSFLPYQVTEAAGMEISKDVPLLVGSTKNEFAPFNPTLRNLTMDKVQEMLGKQYGDKAAGYMKAVATAYPGKLAPDNYVDIDLMFRAGAVKQADMKSKQAAPVYMYLFSWQSPVLDGQFKSMHCMELPFMFNNIDRCREMTGGGKQATVLAEKMSQSWINFARTGNPGHAGLPAWPKYTSENGANMIFDNVSTVRKHHDRELLSIAAGK